MTFVKAIETRYAGYRFRSRLEARWAVFFNFANCRWDYEVEGFDLPSGRYLPDFTVETRDGKLLVEIKPGSTPMWQSIPEWQLGKEMLEADRSLGFMILYGDPYSAFYEFEDTKRHVWAPEPDGAPDFNKPAAAFLSSMKFSTSYRMTGAVQAREARFEHGAGR